MKGMMVTLFANFLLGGCTAQRPNVDGRRHDVYIAGFFPYATGVENSNTGRGVMPSVKLALDHVNEHSTVLRNYRLHMWWNDTMCNAAVGVKAFFDMMHSGPNKLMLFGAACTHVTDPIAKASKHWHLTQLSYADTHPMFTKDSFPNFFRIVPSDNAFNQPRLSLLKEFNWTRVSTLYQNEPRFSLAHNRLVADLDSVGYQVVEAQSFTNEVTTALTKLRDKDTRVILGNFNEYWARKIFCEAYNLEMYGRKYQWVIMGTYSEEWWRKWDADLNCTEGEMETALEQTILTDLLPLSTSGEITVSGITADEYKSEYDSRRGHEYSRFHGYTYDGIWAVALAIQNVAHKIRNYRRNESVTDFRYRDPLWEQLFLEALRNTSFEGVTGPVRFYDNERKAGILLKQFQTGREVKVGEFSAATQHLDLTLGNSLKWIGRYPPKDRTLVIIEHTRVNKTVYAILATLAACGILMAFVFLAFNIKYRNQRYIKMSSPQLNNLIIVGCIFTYISIIFLGLDSGLSSVEIFPYICTARAWTLMAGFSLAFGAMFSKTWRVHSIFTDVKLNKKIIKDYQLFMVVGVLLVIDFAIMITWQVADPFYRETKRMEAYHLPSSEDVIIVPENEYCASKRMTLFIGSIYAYKGLLMIFGAFLAWETRHVSIPALNDSRHVGLSVYNVAIMCICGAAVALVLVDHQDAMFLIISVFIMFCTTATLWLVFVPKMVELRRNPGGTMDKRIRATLRPMGSKTRRDSSATELEYKLKEVKAANSKYRKTLLERESELQMLVRRLGNEASEVLEMDADQVGDSNRLSVPLLRKEQTSATETTDITSTCSFSSQDCASLHRSESQQRKRNGSVHEIDATRKDLDRKTNGSMANGTPEQVQTVCTRRVSVSASSNKPAPIKRQEGVRQHVVAKSELWDTGGGSQHRCTKVHQKVRAAPCEEDDATEDGAGAHHRSVSERNRHHSQKHEKVLAKKEVQQQGGMCGQHSNRYRSTPNVARTAKMTTREKPVHNATSESELLDREILPIFQKLLTERNKSQHSIDYAFGRSCPNISIKCDIVEYL